MNCVKIKKYYESIDENIKKGFRFSVIFIIIKYIINIILHNVPPDPAYNFIKRMANILQDLSLNIIEILEKLSFSFIAAFVFYFIVNHIPRVKEEKKFTRIALKQLRKSVIKQIKLLTFMYKASFRGGINSLPNNLEDLFDEGYFIVIKNLNINCQSPMRADMTWKEYIYKECRMFSRSIERTIMKYSYFLNEDLIDILENLNENNFMDIFLGRKNIFSKDIDGWREEESINNSTPIDGKAEYLFSKKLENGKYILTDHVYYMLKFIKMHNGEFEEKDNIKLSRELLYGDVGPGLGDSISYSISVQEEAEHIGAIIYLSNRDEYIIHCHPEESYSTIDKDLIMIYPIDSEYPTVINTKQIVKIEYKTN